MMHKVMVSVMRHKVMVSVIIILILGWAAYGLIFWHQGSQYVTTDNAYINAAVIPVTTLATGQIINLNVDVGSRVERGQQVAEVGAPRFSDSTDQQGFRPAPPNGTAVEAPVSGFVATVYAYPGAIVSPGSPIITLFDPSNIWVSANIDETEINRVRPGQIVEISVDSLGGTTLEGKVEGISPAAANFFLLPQQNSSSSFSKTVQVVPVKITLENTEGLPLIPGGSVEVKIFTR
jgi:multidrug resistance efflux pump